MLIKGPAQQLADFMIQLSKKHYGQEWAYGLEYELWNELTNEQDLLTDEEIEKLRETCEWCEGWITMAYKDGEESLSFIYLDEWEIKFEKNKPF